MFVSEAHVRDHRRGRRTAVLFRKVRLPGVERRCDVDTICVEDQLEVFESRVKDPGYTACLVRDPLGTGGGILLAPGQEGGRRRFSIAHELAHYHIPTHKLHAEHGLHCGEREMRADAGKSGNIESEANDFASELLMPARQFRIDVAKRDLSVATARELASDAFYDVSVTAAAWRMVQESNDRCAMVVSSNGRIDWTCRSESFRIPGLSRGTQLNSDTLASNGLLGGVSQTRPLEVDVNAWLDPQYPIRGRLLESTHVIRSLDQVVSLLWLIDAEEDPFSD